MMLVWYLVQTNMISIYSCTHAHWLCEQNYYLCFCNQCFRNNDAKIQCSLYTSIRHVSISATASLDFINRWRVSVKHCWGNYSFVLNCLINKDAKGKINNCIYKGPIPSPGEIQWKIWEATIDEILLYCIISFSYPDVLAKL